MDTSIDAPASSTDEVCHDPSAKIMGPGDQDSKQQAIAPASEVERMELEEDMKLPASAPVARARSHVPVPEPEESAGALHHRTDNGVLSAVLHGFEPDARQEQLRYGDSISLVPSGFNAVVAYAGAQDAIPWAQLLKAEVNMPPNLSECQVCR